MQKLNRVWEIRGLLSKLYCIYSNNRLIIKRDIPHKSLFQREVTYNSDLCALRNIV